MCFPVRAPGRCCLYAAPGELLIDCEKIISFPKMFCWQNVRAPPPPLRAELWRMAEEVYLLRSRPTGAAAETAGEAAEAQLRRLAGDAGAEAAPEGEAPPATEGEPAAESAAADGEAEAVPAADGGCRASAEGATEGAAEGAAEGAPRARPRTARPMRAARQKAGRPRARRRLARRARARLHRRRATLTHRPRPQQRCRPYSEGGMAGERWRRSGRSGRGSRTTTGLGWEGTSMRRMRRRTTTTLMRAATRTATSICSRAQR